MPFSDEVNEIHQEIATLARVTQLLVSVRTRSQLRWSGSRLNWALSPHYPGILYRVRERVSLILRWHKLKQYEMNWTFNTEFINILSYQKKCKLTVPRETTIRQPLVFHVGSIFTLGENGCCTQGTRGGFRWLGRPRGPQSWWELSGSERCSVPSTDIVAPVYHPPRKLTW